jgi:hypothetical protein
MVVRFDENDNFDPDDLTWVPTDEEFDEINETRNSLE